MLKNRMIFSEAEREVRSRLTKTVHDEFFIRGALITMKRTCGNKRCKCQKKKELHVSKYLSQSRNGQARLTYVPGYMENQLEKWIRTYKRIKRMTEEVSDFQMIKLSKAKRKGHRR